MKITTTHYLFIIILIEQLFFLGGCRPNQESLQSGGVFVVHYNQPTNYSDTIYVPVDSLKKRFGSFQIAQVQLLDLNNDSLYLPWLVKESGSENPVYLAFCPEIEPSEYDRPFQIVLKTNEESISAMSMNSKVLKYTIHYLIDANSYMRNHPSISWPDAIIQSILTTYPDPNHLDQTAKYNWNYTNGFFINGLMERYLQTKNVEYLNFVKGYFDDFLDEQGNLDTLQYPVNKHELDAILPGRALLELYTNTQNEKYKHASQFLIEQLKLQPRTNNGGFWHKTAYPYQMWLDGIYMADVFMLEYAHQMTDSSVLNDALKQFNLIHEHTWDSVSGLLYHGWDETKSRKWANLETGTSPEFWGRSIGWYIMALVDGLDELPENSDEHEQFLHHFIQLASSLSSYQDAKTGLWYQVVNKADSAGNWPETSCTAMFAYAFAKGVNKGYLDKTYLEKADKAFEGLKNHFIWFDDSGHPHLTGTVVVGTLNEKYSDGSYKYYTSVNRRFDDFKGIAALLYLSMELEKTKED